jgi:uncharacterized protein YqjF (DUF2071 family)
LEDLKTEESRWPGRVFLSAEWRDLVMLNYQVDPAFLREYVPGGTELDLFNGAAFISLVGFQFLRAKVLGALAFAFREIVPKQLIAQVARLAYGENYSCFPMRHRVNTKADSKMAEYEWGVDQKWCKLYAQGSGIPAHPREGTLEEFITEHYWGYSAGRHGWSLEYRVSHTPWRVWTSAEAGFEGDGTSTYGQRLGSVLNRRPDSAFIAEGSPVLIYMGRLIT